MDKHNAVDVKIGEIVVRSIERSSLTQKHVARELGISAPSLSKMLKGGCPLPLERFFQIIGIVEFSPPDAKEIISIYKARFNLPDEAFFLLGNSWIQSRFQKLLQLPESELADINRKEIEVIRYWNNGCRDDQSDTDYREALRSYADALSQEEARKGLEVLKLIFG